MFHRLRPSTSALRFLWATMALTAGVLALVGWLAVRRDQAFTRLVHEGTSALGRSDLAAAIEAFSGAVALRPDSMLAHLRRGEAYQERGDLDLARRDLTRAIELDATATRPLEALGDVNTTLGRYAAAADRYETYLRLDDRSPTVAYKLGLVRWRVGQPALALAAFDLARSLGLDGAELDFAEALSHLDLGRTPEALESLRAGVTKNPAHRGARHELHRLYARLNRHADDLVQLEALVALEPDSLEYRLALARCHALLGHLETATLTLERAAARFPERHDPAVALGEVWLDQHERSKTPASLARALQALEPLAGELQSSRALTTLGRAQLLAGRPRAALRSLNEASTRLPVDSRCLALLADAARRTGENAVERDALERAEALEGGSAGGALRLSRLLRLGTLALLDGDRTEGERWLVAAARLAIAQRSPRLAEVLQQLREAGFEERARSLARPAA
jgi:tetratricopeptide (TPR) repeat protein